MRHKTYYDDSSVLKIEEATSAVTIYVETTGDDDTGDGSSGKPYKTIGRALRDHPIRPLYTRTIELGVGTFTLPYAFSSGKGPWGGVTIKGTTQTVESSETIASITTSSRDNGLILQITGAAWVVDEHKGKNIKFTSGVLNNKDGVVIKNTADTLYVTSSATSWATPSNGDTLDILTHNTTINIPTTNPDRCYYSLTFINFQDVKFTGGYIGVDQSLMQFTRCWFANEEFVGSPFSRVLTYACYIAPTLNISVAHGEWSRTDFCFGTVIDFLGSKKMAMLQGSMVTFWGECVISNTSSDGLALSQGCKVYPFQGNTNDTFRVVDCDELFKSNSDEGGDNHIISPYAAGTITGDYVFELLGHNNQTKIIGGAITTALGSNTKDVGDFSFDGGIRYSTQRTASDLTVKNRVTYVGVTDTTAPRQITLRTSAIKDGKIYKIKDESGGAGTNNITIVGQGGETIDGAANYVMTNNYECIEVISDGTNWFII